ncbi:MAG: hypothetical protein LBI13_06020 [Streptococcaceae bacterium]|jgi:hypothetical protein|nr:hypothetical protein [Streptococcaceae bacterium]
MNSDKRQSEISDDKNVLRQIALYTALHGSVIPRSLFNRYAKDPKVSRENITKSFAERVQIFLEKGNLSDLSYQVLSNASQKLSGKNPDLEEVINYVSLWMKKVEMREELTADEKLIKEVFSVDTVLKDLDITQLEEQIQKNHEKEEGE